jgi:hypothetical protein
MRVIPTPTKEKAEIHKRWQKKVTSNSPTACSFGWWLMAVADLFREKNTIGWLLVAVKPSEHGVSSCTFSSHFAFWAFCNATDKPLRVITPMHFYQSIGVPHTDFLIVLAFL